MHQRRLCMTEACSIHAKVHKIAHKPQTNLANGADSNKTKNEISVANQNCEFFKTKNLTNQKAPKYRLFHDKMASPGPTPQQHPQTQTILPTDRKITYEKTA